MLLVKSYLHKTLFCRSLACISPTWLHEAMEAQSQSRKKSTKPADLLKEDLSKPVQFSKSPAFKFRPEQSYAAALPTDRPWFQPYIVLASMAVFMAYFFILREENDIDGRLGSQSVEAQLRNYEIQMLKASLEKCRLAGADTFEIEERLLALTGTPKEAP